MISAEVRLAAIKASMPSSMNYRPVDHRGFPVPWFVTEKDDEGHWDFVNIDPERFYEAVRQEKCWVSGQALGRFKAFCVGPMCAINRTAGDAPVTREIALWSVKVCPFMSRPRARRADKTRDMIDNGELGGIGLTRNPGVTAVWLTRNSEYQPGRGFYLGDPIEVSWWREGRPATRIEVENATESGIHVLESSAQQEGNGAVEMLEKFRAEAEKLWPAE